MLPLNASPSLPPSDTVLDSAFCYFITFHTFPTCASHNAGKLLEQVAGTAIVLPAPIASLRRIWRLQRCGLGISGSEPRRPEGRKTAFWVDVPRLRGEAIQQKRNENGMALLFISSARSTAWRDSLGIPHRRGLLQSPDLRTFFKQGPGGTCP